MHDQVDIITEYCLSAGAFLLEHHLIIPTIEGVPFPRTFESGNH